MRMFARQTERGRAPGAVRGGIARDERSVLFGGARRRRIIAWSLIVALLAAAATAVTLLVTSGGEAEAARRPPAVSGFAPSAPEPPADDGQAGSTADVMPEILWKNSRALGKPFSGGRLVDGVQLPASGPDWFTWDPAFDRSPNRGFRRWGTDALLRTILRVLREYRTDDLAAPRVGIGDLARRNGGPFGREFGGLGHASHQNGLDVDVLYPRKDERERLPFRPSQVDRERAQDLVDRFVAAGAEKVFVGPRVNLKGPRNVVIALAYHDDHLHVRLPRRGDGG